MSAIEDFKEMLRKLCTELENMAIENQTYSDLLIEHGWLNLAELRRLVQVALDDPEKRKEAREQFSEMWKALDQYGTAAWYEEVLRDFPSSGKPN